jgi:coenzyme F420-reducing hydrogenase gamma subunit
MRPRLALIKLASCDGCQVTFLDLEDELLAIGKSLEIAHFAEASSRLDLEGPYDLTLVEGSVSQPRQIDIVRHARAVSKRLVTIGACASAGGLQALRNWANHEEYLSLVYAQPEYVATLAESRPASAFVPVDFELQGCPPDRHQLLEVITAFLVGRRPGIRPESVCLECKRAGNICVHVAYGIPCLGPVTQAGCGALCPGKKRGCYSCFGPREGANTQSLADDFERKGLAPAEVARRFRLIYGWAPPFRAESARREAKDES